MSDEVTQCRSRGKAVLSTGINSGQRGRKDSRTWKARGSAKSARGDGVEPRLHNGEDTSKSGGPRGRTKEAEHGLRASRRRLQERWATIKGGQRASTRMRWDECEVAYSGARSRTSEGRHIALTLIASALVVTSRMAH